MTFGIRFLTGYSASFDMATQKAEWPPHPARIFMAMAATFFETGAEPEEQRALEWLESQQAPTIHASEAEVRSNYDVFVPVNDSASGIANRSRQVRQFAKCRPHCDTIYLRWGDDCPDDVSAAMEALCAKVTRLGHSASLVQMWVSADEPAAGLQTWIPTDGAGGERLRVAEAGMLADLERQFNGRAIQEYAELEEQIHSARGRAKAKLKTEAQERFPAGPPKSSRPTVRATKAYQAEGRAGEAATELSGCGPFDSGIILLRKLEGPNLGLESTLQLTGALRNAVMKHGPQPPPAWISGHAPDGSPVKRPHLAFFPL
ncbi:MAG: type I-U CRISPR-associated protein Cas5/Cas6, partial [Bryobacterales bacterium]|nr:type I-U CRISPR-associated protein Cas5/Cas6 [Bryobacterales bacterium]